ncbi:hypothetical protein ACQ4PT_015629 [Festuca glaucescens]
MHLHVIFPLAISLLLVLSPAAVRRCAAQERTGDAPPYKPLVSPLARDSATSLYTITIQDSGPLIVDLAGPLVWSTCASGHPTFSCSSRECAAANGDGVTPAPAPAPRPSCRKSPNCACTAHPCNPVTGRCAAGDLTSSPMSANTTDGRSLLPHPVSFSIVASCAPENLLQSLPAGAVGVAGLSRAPLSLPSQLAARRGLGSRFALCLPGVAVFGNTTIYLMGFPLELTAIIGRTPLVKNPKRSGDYYIPAVAITMVWASSGDTPAALPPRALELDPATGRGGVTLSTVAQYTAMRSDVYGPFLQAFDAAIGAPGTVKKVPEVAPFKLCYDTWSLRPLKRLGWDVPIIRLELAAGASSNWTMYSGNSLVQVGDRTMCLAFLEMAGGGGSDDGPAVVIGTHQLEDNLLVFDADNEELRFSGILRGSGATCSTFNFTA